MFYRSFTPAPPLGDFVDRLWLCADAPSHARERIMPSGTVELVVNLGEDEVRIIDPARPGGPARYSGAVVSGPYGRFFAIDPRRHASVVAVHFKPGGAPAVLGLPAHELADRHVDLEAIWGPAAADLRERLCAAATTAQRFALLGRALAARLRRPADGRGAVAVALGAFERPGVRVRDVARRVGLSQRRFIQVFAAEVGLTPKLYSRVRRFQRARELVRDSPAPDWARVAAEGGYFDQSHLIRDFRAFAGLGPADYLRHRSDHALLNHVPLPR